MKKLLLFLFMCLSSILIYDNVHAASIDENVILYFQENYSEYINDYWTIGQVDNLYFIYTSSSENMVIRKDNVQMTAKNSSITVRMITLNSSDMSLDKNISRSVSVDAAVSSLFLKYSIDYADYFIYSNYDLYDSKGTLILAKNYPIEVEPSPSPSPEPSPSPSPEPSPSPDIPPDTPALPGDEGGVSANDVIKVYMKYFLMGLPVALIMVSIEKFTEIFHNFVLGKMRK